MDLPGIDVRPIIDMTGIWSFNEVFLNDVRLPADRLRRRAHDGWRLAKVTLSNERVSLSTGGVLWGRGPTALDVIDDARRAGSITDGDETACRRDVHRAHRAGADSAANGGGTPRR